MSKHASALYRRFMASPSLRKTLFLKHKVLVPSFLFKGAILHQQCFMRGDELQPQHWEITAASSSTTSLIHTSSWCVLERIRNWNTACSVVLEARILDFSLNLPTFLRHNQGQRNINGLHTRLGPTVCVPQASAGEPCSVLMAVLHFQKTPDCSLQTQGRNKRNLGRRCSTLPPFSWEEISLSC